MRYFNTSGPNIPSKHYTIERTKLIQKGVNLVKDERYFTIWAPRQTGKSTYFLQLADELEKQDYKVAHISFEGYTISSIKSFIEELIYQLNNFWNTKFIETELHEVFNEISKINTQKCVLIIDEVEGINPEYFGTFLHSIRRVYHSRHKHCLKSVILVGVSNIVGVVNDNASPFNITDNLNVPYFTKTEVFELIELHENETKQKFNLSVKDKICQITANQPGLVNGFANKLVDNEPDKNEIDYNDYLKVEHWYLNIAIDKNFANILNKAKQERKFVERLLFTPAKIPFKIDRESIKLLHTNGLIKEDGNGFVTFWVPFYKKRLYNAFYPYTNGETDNILRSFVVSKLFDKNNKLNLENLITGYKTYTKRRGFNVFREKDEKGNYKSIKESSLIYSFETYIQAFLQVVDGKSYREADTGLGKSDLVINVNSEEYLIETKIYYYESQFLTGQKQLAYYCSSLELAQGIFLVFYPSDLELPKTVTEQTKNIKIKGKTIKISTYLVTFDETKW